MEEIINQLLVDIIPIIYNGISEENWSIVKEEYHKILLNRYSDIDKKLNTEDYTSLYNSLYNSEIEEWENMDLNTKKSILIPDPALESIIDISNMSYKYAKDKILNKKNISEEIVDAYLTKLDILSTKVAHHNQDKAEWSIKEATIDLLYASNQSDSISNRINDLL